MKILFFLSSLLFLAAALGCGHAPTEPLPPAKLDLNGNWRGTFDTTGCPPNEMVQAVIRQDPNGGVFGTFQTQCVSGSVDFDGTLSNGNFLRIELVGGNDITIDKLAGYVSSQDIDMSHATTKRTTKLHLSR